MPCMLEVRSLCQPAPTCELQRIAADVRRRPEREAMPCAIRLHSCAMHDAVKFDGTQELQHVAATCRPCDAAGCFAAQLCGAQTLHFAWDAATSWCRTMCMLSVHTCGS